jgi:tRNA threonylcarbamoyladenosine biosynthesis protein TsaE
VSGKQWSIAAIDEDAMRALAARLATAASAGGALHLEGDLGAGKTTFARALLTAIGVGERIKSPTYSLLESYRVGDLDAHHLDLYRIADAGELEWLGLADLWTPSALVLIEWPERGRGALPPPDLRLRFDHAGDRRNLAADAFSERGQRLIDVLDASASPAG